MLKVPEGLGKETIGMSFKFGGQRLMQAQLIWRERWARSQMIQGGEREEMGQHSSDICFKMRRRDGTVTKGDFVGLKAGLV